MIKAFEENKKDLSYYLTLFQLEGHTTWRAHLSNKVDAFELDTKKNWGKNAPTITAKRIIKIDRVTGLLNHP